MSKSKSESRYRALDGLRGVAALMVAVFHFGALWHLAGFPLIANAYLFVDFFFVLSGFVIAHAYGRRLGSALEVAQFATRRLGRVYPLHIAALAALVALEAIKLVGTRAGVLHPLFEPFSADSAMAGNTLPHQLLLTHALGFLDRLTWNHPSWSISAEFWTYLVFAALMVGITRERMRTIAFTGLAVLSLGLVAANSTDGMNVTYDLGFWRCLAGFMTGVLTFELVGRFLDRAPTGRARLLPTFHAGVAECTMAGIALLFVLLAGHSFVSLLAPLVFAPLVAILAFSSGPVSQVLLTRPLQNLGAWSYSIYMVHVPILTVLLPLVARGQYVTFADGSRYAAGLSPIAYDAVFVGYIAAVIGLASLTYRRIELPGQRAFARLAQQIGKAPLAEEPLPPA